MGKPSAPKPPSPTATAAAQTSSNVATAMANTAMGQVNQVGPNGSLTYAQTGSTQYRDPTTGRMTVIPQYTATQSLSAQGQRINDQNQAAQYNLARMANTQSDRLNDHLGRGFSMDGLPAWGQTPQAYMPQMVTPGASLDMGAAQGGAVQGSVRGRSYDTGAAQGGAIQRSYGTDYSKNVQRVEDALMARLTPQLDRDRAAMDAQLANQGITMGSRAYSAAQGERSQAATDARLGVILSAGQEQNRLAGLARDQATFANSAQAQAFGQDASNIQMQNAARAQQFAQGLAKGQFANQAQAQRFGQDAANIQMQNAARQQAFGMKSGRIGQNNAAMGQYFGQGMQAAGMQDQRRGQALQERLTARNQPINEIAALMSGSQVAMPNFGVATPDRIAGTDVAGIMQQGYQNQYGNYANQMNQWQQMMGGLFGIGRSAVGLM